MINPWRLAQTALLCEVGVVAWFVVVGPASIEKAAAPALNRLAPLLTASYAPVPAAAARPKAIDNVVTGSIDIAKAAELLVKEAANDATAVPSEPKPIVLAALTERSEVMPSDTPSIAAVAPAEPAAPTDPAAAASTPDPAPQDIRDALNSVEIFDECFVPDACVDRYLWAIYKRTRKEDSVKEDERRQVTVKRKGKTVTVTRTVSRVVDEDFAWKDPKAADKAGIAMMDYVIGGMDRSFKLRLFNLLRAAEAAGLSPGITSAFRDDYRQSIASGLHAASDRSYHGGSSHGGYGHGLAADIVSVKGGTRGERQASSENLWKWVDTHGKEYGIGRPYLGRDPPHVAPIDGEEYVKHRGTAVARR